MNKWLLPTNLGDYLFESKLFIDLILTIYSSFSLASFASVSYLKIVCISYYCSSIYSLYFSISSYKFIFIYSASSSFLDPEMFLEAVINLCCLSVNTSSSKAITLLLSIIISFSDKSSVIIYFFSLSYNSCCSYFKSVAYSTSYYSYYFIESRTYSFSERSSIFSALSYSLTFSAFSNEKANS